MEMIELGLIGLQRTHFNTPHCNIPHNNTRDVCSRNQKSTNLRMVHGFNFPKDLKKVK